MDAPVLLPTREQLIHALYEAAEIEHNLMCTYLYAAFSLKDGEAEGLNAEEAEAVKRWRRAIVDVSIDEMGHLAAVWNITAGVGGMPRFGRVNFPIDPGYLPAGIVVKLAPFSEDVLQHFIFLERPKGSDEPEGKGFECTRTFSRAAPAPRLTPMGFDYATVGEFYETMEAGLDIMSRKLGEKELFCGDPALQLSPSEIDLSGAKPVLCTKTAKQACAAIITQGEGASEENPDSHYCRFRKIREELTALKAKNPRFEPAHAAATNPVLRRPPQPEGRVWIEDPEASAIVDVANASYQTMLRLIAHAYVVPSPSAEKSLAVDLGIDLMKALALLGESAARRPAGPSNPDCNAGVSFTALRDSAPLPRAASTRRFFVERMAELAKGAARLDQSDTRVARAAGLLKALAARATKFADMSDEPVASSPSQAAAPPSKPAPPQHIVDGVEIVEGETVTIHYQGKLCIHSRFCVTGAPKVFLANVEGPWIHPDDMDAEELMAVARECPSGAIQYRRNDGGREEQAPPVNLIRTLEAGPYTFRGDLRIDGEPIGFRATLCRCGASKNKPFCDGSHHEMGFTASGEPPTGDKTAMLAVRDGPIDIAPQLDGPLMVRGNMEIIASTGRMVARMTAARFCRCGHSNTKPFCDGTHAKIGFKST
ncbi:ferritin-like domain-containing protein [Terricaulis silvestris]|uniref:Violacein biosynthesis protein VioB n=1 Tax=Terricaulis silvestris TaxID=2686094 RepID=A0A6I6MLC6_9CAUL|nr:ferritin-like domain-containing protein [Terricaulis silvestris]QGZ94841.1 Violacein biosynthesis protein VioB [Terricaulis silvestris]